MELKTTYSTGYLSTTFFAAYKENKYFTEIIGEADSNRLEKSSNNYPFEPKKSFYDGEKKFIMYGFVNEHGLPDHNYDNVGININPGNSKISLKHDIGVYGIPEFYDFFNWYESLLNGDYKPKFTNQQEIYNGLSCRVIEFNKKENTRTLKNGKIYKSVNVTTACVNDKYGIALYIKNLTYNAENKFDFYEQINSLSNIQVNNVNNSVFELPKKILGYNASLSDITKEINK